MGVSYWIICGRQGRVTAKARTTGDTYKNKLLRERRSLFFLYAPEGRVRSKRRYFIRRCRGFVFSSL